MKFLFFISFTLAFNTLNDVFSVEIEGFIQVFIKN